jgi:hypothetical protein
VGSGQWNVSGVVGGGDIHADTENGAAEMNIDGLLNQVLVNLVLS